MPCTAKTWNFRPHGLKGPELSLKLNGARWNLGIEKGLRVNYAYIILNEAWESNGLQVLQI